MVQFKYKAIVGKILLETKLPTFFLKFYNSLTVMPLDRIIRMAPAAGNLNGPTSAAFLFIFALSVTVTHNKLMLKNLFIKVIRS